MFDSVLLISFGGPQGPADIRPFLANVLRGRRVAAGRVEEVAHHYELVRRRVADHRADARRRRTGCASASPPRVTPLPVFVGMRNWHPLPGDTLAPDVRGPASARRWVSSPPRTALYSSCHAVPRERPRRARGAAARAGGPDVEVTYVGSWFDHPLFIEANASTCATRSTSCRRISAPARLVFTAHSIPDRRWPARSVPEQFEESARLVAESAGDGRLGARCIRAAAAVRRIRGSNPTSATTCARNAPAGLEAAVLCPVGFVCDHVEVLYDLDIEAADVCRAIGLPMARAEAVNDDPLFLDMMADVVLQTLGRYGARRALSLAMPTSEQPDVRR